MGKCEQSLIVTLEPRAYSLRCFFPSQLYEARHDLRDSKQPFSSLVGSLIGIRTIRRVLSYLLKFETVVFSTSNTRGVSHGFETIVCTRFVVPVNHSRKQANHCGGAHNRNNNVNSAAAVISLRSSRGTLIFLPAWLILDRVSNAGSPTSPGHWVCARPRSVP